MHQPSEDVALLPVGTRLLRRHANAEDLVGPHGQFREHCFASAAEQNRFELAMDLVQAAVAE